MWRDTAVWDGIRNGKQKKTTREQVKKNICKIYYIILVIVHTHGEIKALFFTL